MVSPRGGRTRAHARFLREGMLLPMPASRVVRAAMRGGARGAPRARGPVALAGLVWGAAMAAGLAACAAGARAFCPPAAAGAALAAARRPAAVPRGCRRGACLQRRARLRVGEPAYWERRYTTRDKGDSQDDVDDRGAGWLCQYAGPLQQTLVSVTREDPQSRLGGTRVPLPRLGADLVSSPTVHEFSASRGAAGALACFAGGGGGGCFSAERLGAILECHGATVGQRGGLVGLSWDLAEIIGGSGHVPGMQGSDRR
ncbi:unnamed protein product [Prorocentrum cordatum]|uniref:Uncharacterized protein n=1 Tax=Prorocentrum cordatum TaxID=2364126 RepID=A0ABN9S711_9DINO|nr:unnamed protein product [Polarella glacialis]